MVPVAHASDGGGSIRIPASACGLVGLKPSRGRVPLWPEVAEGWGGMAVEGVVSRSVPDTAVMLGVAAGPCPGDLYTSPLPRRPYRKEVGADPGRLRIGLLTTAPDPSIATHPECVAAAKGVLESLGHTVEPEYPPALADPTSARRSCPVMAPGQRCTWTGGASCWVGPSRLRTWSRRPGRWRSWAARSAAPSSSPPCMRCTSTRRGYSTGGPRAGMCWSPRRSRSHHRRLASTPPSRTTRLADHPRGCRGGLHHPVQHNRTAGDQPAAALDRRRPAGWGAAGGRLRPRGPAGASGRPAGAGAPWTDRSPRVHA
jgi:amidase